MTASMIDSMSASVTAPRLTFQDLQERFISGLGRRVASLRECAAVLREGGDDDAATVDEMMRGFHSLAGIGGTYGFASITDVARRGELACRAIGEHPSASDLASIERALMSLTDAAASVVVRLQHSGTVEELRKTA